MTSQLPFTDVPSAIEEIRSGRMIVVVDDEDRENEGDLTLAAEKVTPEAINFMAKYGRGLVCLALTEERLDHLRIGPMTSENTSNYGTAFCEAIDARDGVTTGISAYDRARTIQVAIDPATRPSDLARPGHVFPLRARKGGVLVRAGQTEASVDLARLAGLGPAGIICEIMGDVFGSTVCDCHATIEGSLQMIEHEGRGALIYLHQTSKGFSVERIGERTALAFHRERHLPAGPESERRTQREIGIGAQILSDLKLRRIRLLTNHPRKVAALEGFGIEIVEQIPVLLDKARVGI